MRIQSQAENGPVARILRACETALAEAWSRAHSIHVSSQADDEFLDSDGEDLVPRFTFTP